MDEKKPADQADGDTLLSGIVEEELERVRLNAGSYLTRLLLSSPTVGDLLKLNYEEATILIHDYHRSLVRGLPSGSFLVASRMRPGANDVDADDEDACLVLLRIVGDCPLPNAAELDQFRFQAGMRANDSDQMWDDKQKIDEWTRNSLSFGGYRCNVLGTFRMRPDSTGKYELSFGADLLNYYSGRGMKVFKPIGNLLKEIVNFQRPDSGAGPLRGARIRLGRVRYAAAEIGTDETKDNVEVLLDPTDLISRRTFYGGMSRGGKSNAMKIAAASIYMLRATRGSAGRVGQLIFDPNGEYANVNTQDRGCIRNVYRRIQGAQYADEIATYGLNPHPNDPTRRIVKINFYGAEPTNWTIPSQVGAALDQLVVGKSIIDAALRETTAQYVKAFRDTNVDVPATFPTRGDATRFQRRIIVYRAALKAAGFAPPSASVRISGLFGQDLRSAMVGNTARDQAAQAQIAAAGQLLGNSPIQWDDLLSALKGLRLFMSDNSSGYQAFEQQYRNGHSGRSWADESLINMLEIFAYPNGVRTFRHLAAQHTPAAMRDYAEDIVDDLRAGKLVIFDQSTGDPELNQAAAERIMWAIFERQKADFVNPRLDTNGQLIPPPPVMAYLEEAHNLLPAAGGRDELRTVWARTAKEGSKYRIGMVLATQEPSSVMPAILKNTDNWFIAHLNNADEINTVAKFYDFKDFGQQIKRVQDPGFVRMRTLSNPYTVPVQIDLFEAPAEN